MKKLQLVLILLLAAMMLMVSACGDDDDDNGSGISGIPDITPENYDWDIYFIGYSHFDEKSMEYQVWADWLGEPEAISQNDMFTIKINGETHEFYSESWGGYWSIYTTVELEPGTEYSVTFYKNGNSVASTNLKLVYQPTVNFPSTYNPTEATEINWTMSGNNQYQGMSLMSFSADYDEEDDWEKTLSPSDRDVTIPANAVSSFGPETEYDITLVQLNFKKDKRVAFSSIAAIYAFYGDSYALEDKLEDARKLAKSYRNQY